MHHPQIRILFFLLNILMSIFPWQDRDFSSELDSAPNSNGEKSFAFANNLMYSLCVLAQLCLQDIAGPHAVWEAGMWGEEQGAGEGTWSPCPFLSISSWVTKSAGISYLGSFLCGTPIIRHFPKEARSPVLLGFIPSLHLLSHTESVPGKCWVTREDRFSPCLWETSLVKSMNLSVHSDTERRICSLIPRIRCNLSKFSLITMRKPRPKKLGEGLRVSESDSQFLPLVIQFFLW